MGRNCQLAIQDETGRELANYKVPYGTRILVEEDSKVKNGTKICEWDPFTNPVISEKSGFAIYVDMEEGVSLIEETEEKLRVMFKEIQGPFAKVCPKGRKNFLSYSYVLHKFAELLELDDFLMCFPFCVLLFLFQVSAHSCL